jgi:very-short-patch-repair endonuclease
MSPKPKKRKLIERSDGSWHQETQSENIIRNALLSQGLEFKQEQIIAGIKVDFYLPAVQAVIEVDGESHLTTEKKQRDLATTERLISLGIRVIRISGMDAHSPQVVRDLLQGLKQEETHWRKITGSPDFNNPQLKEKLSQLKNEGKL